ncbi:MAG: DUF29 domain-containing protein [Gomphosphaeria aponina SAG 52.96 = DSM 107014]|uniref:DUF29 domain-containing protein n=1 Tax=Gomphosphaeria aponina SAG 52.96 = DSM 107014 TaxID=1521640 RepID=A0A941GSB0_9CHRO|nr:DUF29 domain-containing protein [Gomphosphaeria aponina SAG 52.96 = DSM 107014]
MTVTTNLKQLYEIDDHLWLLATIELLKEKKFNQLDLENLIEELVSLGKRDQVIVESLLEQIIRHLLLLQYWQVEYERNAHHWQIEIKSFRKQVKKMLTTNLRNHLLKQLASIYGDALEYVQGKTQFQVDFPEECPYTLEQLLEQNYD